MEEYAVLAVQKVKPEYERYAVNASLVYFILEYYQEKLKQKYYIVDGERSISHETSFQDYLEKYFGFRKAYCYLHIEYRPIIEKIVFFLYPFQKALNKFDQVRIIHEINAVLNMEQIKRNDKEIDRKN